MYAKDTILALKEQRPADAETGEDFPYNRVRVVGESPVSHSHADGKWQGGDAAGVIITPVTNFGATLDEPFGKLRALYDVESLPEREVPTEAKLKIIDSATSEAGPTPEEVIAAEAPGTPPKPGERRGRTSPLGEVKNEAAEGPLGDAEPSVTPPEPAEEAVSKPVEPAALDPETKPSPLDG